MPYVPPAGRRTVRAACRFYGKRNGWSTVPAYGRTEDQPPGNPDGWPSVLLESRSGGRDGLQSGNCREDFRSPPCATGSRTALSWNPPPRPQTLLKLIDREPEAALRALCGPQAPLDRPNAMLRPPLSLVPIALPQERPDLLRPLNQSAPKGPAGRPPFAGEQQLAEAGEASRGRRGGQGGVHRELDQRVKGRPPAAEGVTHPYAGKPAGLDSAGIIGHPVQQPVVGFHRGVNTDHGTYSHRRPPVIGAAVPKAAHLQATSQRSERVRRARAVKSLPTPTPFSRPIATPHRALVRAYPRHA